MVSQYIEKNKQCLAETQKLFPQARQVSKDKVSLVIVKDQEKNTMNIVVATEDNAYEMKI